MNTAYQIVVCAGIVPDPLQPLEPNQFSIANLKKQKDDMLLPAVLDPIVAAARQSAANFSFTSRWRLSAESRYAPDVLRAFTRPIWFNFIVFELSPVSLRLTAARESLWARTKQLPRAGLSLT